MRYYLILLRHGESEWNKQNRFGGWTDLRLSQKGREEARHAGDLLKLFEHPPQAVYTSKLSRTIETAALALEQADRLWLDTTHSWRLNERHYGALQGRNKEDVLKEYGHEKYMLFRRSFDVPPPAIAPDDEWSQVGDPRYSELLAVPLTESLHTMGDRILPFWEDTIAVDLQRRGSVLVIGHGNSLRGLIRLVRGVSNEVISKEDIPTGRPFVMELDENMKPVDPENWMYMLGDDQK